MTLAGAGEDGGWGLAGGGSDEGQRKAELKRGHAGSEEGASRRGKRRKRKPEMIKALNEN